MGIGDALREAPEPWMAEGSVQGRIYSVSRKASPIPILCLTGLIFQT